MVLPIASDHAGFPAKELVKKYLQDNGHLVVDYGTHSEDSVDYPDYASLVAKAIGNNEYERGILICGSGQGVCMTANKIPQVRAALVWNAEIAEMSRLHNDSNILCLPGRYLSADELTSIVQKWIDTDFEGGRHQRRVDKIATVTAQ